MGELSADPARDEQYQQAALRLANQRLKAVRQASMDPSTIERAQRTGVMSFNVFVEEEEAERIDLEPFGFKVHVAKRRPGSSTAASFRPETGKLAVAVFALPANFQELSSGRGQRKLIQKHLGKKLAKDSAAAHEFIHMFDFLRGNVQMTPGEVRRSLMPESMTQREHKEAEYAAYINTPHEFNAHFQQGVIETLQKLRVMNPGNRRRVFGDYAKFVEVAEKTDPIGSLRRAGSEKYQRKLDHR
jgi:hypothetical protein